MTALRVYVAASSAPDQMARAHAVSRRLREASIELTSTWIANIADVGDANPRDASRELRAQWADSCLVGVEQADVVILLVPPPSSPTKGAWVEFGYATARDKRIVASGDTASTIFCGMEHVTEVADDDAAIEAVLCAASGVDGDADIFAELMKLREQLIARGVVVDAEAWRKAEEP